MDGFHKTINWANLDGSEQSVLTELDLQAGPNPIFGLALNAGLIYVSMWGGKGVWEIDISDGNTLSRKQVIGQQLGDDVIFSLASSDINMQPLSKY